MRSVTFTTFLQQIIYGKLLLILIWTHHLNFFFSSILASNNPLFKIYCENVILALLNFNFLFFILFSSTCFFFFFLSFSPPHTYSFPSLYLHFSFYFSSLPLHPLQNILETLSLSHTHRNHRRMTEARESQTFKSTFTHACPLLVLLPTMA